MLLLVFFENNRAAESHDLSSSITGKVIDAVTLEPLVGANILVVDSKIGVSTNTEGIYNLKLDPGNYDIKVSYLGYLSKTINVTVQDNKTTELNISLDKDILRTEEIVVTGQGVGIQRERLSTITTTITSEEIEQIPASRIEDILQSALPNAQINLRSGQAGGTSKIRTRGVVSAYKSSTPVIYIDGVRVDNLNSAASLSLNISGSASQGAAVGALADIPVENIERIEYINGGAATTLYGSDAANGVIQIFTKEGVPERSELSLETRFGAEVATEDYLYFDKTGELLYDPGFVQQYLLSGSGGSKSFNYSFSGSVRGSDGYRIDNSASQNYSLRTKISAKINPSLKYIASFGYNRSDYDRVRDGNAGSYAPLWLLEGCYLKAIFGYANLNNTTDAEFQETKAFIEKAEELQDNNYIVDRFQTSQKLEFNPVENFTVHATAGLDYRKSNEKSIVTSEYLTLVNSTSTDGYIQNYDRTYIGLTLEAAALHKLYLGDFSVISTVGAQVFRNEDKQSEIIGNEIRDGAKIVSGAGSTTSEEAQEIVANYGFYIQQNYGYADKYFLEYGFRADGNSAFGDDIKTQIYPKVGLSYVFSEEDFYKTSGLSNYLSYIRLRGNYGEAGNFPPPFINDRTIDFTSYQGYLAANLGQSGNKDLKPERTKTFEIGTDLALFNDRSLSLNLTYYSSITEDALFQVPGAPSDGEETTIKNVGEIENSGFELAATANIIKTKNVNLTLNASYNTLHNKVNKSSAAAFAIGGFSSRTVQSVVEEGQPVGYIRGTKTTIGSDGEPVTETLAFLGKTQPDYFGSVSLNLTLYKRFSLLVTADYQAGAYAHNFNTQFRYYLDVDKSLVPEALRDQSWLNVTNYFVEKTDFFKVRLISMTYTIPESFYENLFRKVDIGFSVSNPFNFYSATFDPEADASSARSQGSVEGNGVSYGIESAPRTYLTSLKFWF
jgi:outer membrane receptor protein involved in Fe transport